MKKLVIIFLIMISISCANAQYKDSGFHESDIKNAIVDNSNSSASFLGFLNPNNFQMHQSYDFSYSTFGSGQGLAMGVLTNSMLYNFTNNFSGQLDISLVHSPYSSFGRDFQNKLNGIYISKAVLNYQPWKNMLISVQYRNLPYSSYYNPFYPYVYGYDNFENYNSILIR